MPSYLPVYIVFNHWAVQVLKVYWTANKQKIYVSWPAAIEKYKSLPLLKVNLFVLRSKLSRYSLFVDSCLVLMLAQIILQADPVQYTGFYEKIMSHRAASRRVLAELSRSFCSSFVLFLPTYSLSPAYYQRSVILLYLVDGNNTIAFSLMLTHWGRGHLNCLNCLNTRSRGF